MSHPRPSRAALPLHLLTGVALAAAAVAPPVAAAQQPPPRTASDQTRAAAAYLGRVVSNTTLAATQVGRGQVSYSGSVTTLSNGAFELQAQLAGNAGGEVVYGRTPGGAYVQLGTGSTWVPVAWGPGARSYVNAVEYRVVLAKGGMPDAAEVTRRIVYRLVPRRAGV